jgi:hypothetical protein
MTPSMPIDPVPARRPMRMLTRGAAAISAVAISAMALCAVALLAAVSPALHAQVAAPARTTAAIPDRLSDAEFWRLSTELSEPGGWFRSENFVSNETRWQHVIAPLERVVPTGGVYLGVGPEQNFTYLVAFRPRIAFIVDIRRQNLVQHLLYKAAIELSPDRATFLARIFGRPRPPGLDSTAIADDLIDAFERVAPDSAYFARTLVEMRRHLVETRKLGLSADDLAMLAHVDSAFFLAGPALNYSFGTFGGGMGRMGRMMPTFGELMRETDAAGTNRGFLGSEANYRALREMQLRNLVVPVTGDFAGPHALRAVGRWIADRGAVVNLFYLSNVEQYLFQSDAWSRFYATVGTLPLDSTSHFIRSVTNNRWANTPPTNAMMAQLTSPILEVVEAYDAGRITGYYDVIALSRWP